MNNDKLFRQALQRQNDRAAGMKMPDDMEQRVMKSLQDPPQPSLKGRESSPFKGELERVWRSRGVWVAIAASVLLLIMLNIGKQKQEQQPPVIAEVVTEPQNNIAEETPQATAPTIVTEQKQPAMAQAERPKLTRRQKPTVRKETIAEPPAEEAVSMETPAEGAFPEDRLLDMNNPYLIAAAQLQDVRERGERLDREVAMLMNRQ